MGIELLEQDNRILEFSIHNEAEILHLGEMIGARLKSGDLLFLFGELGAGKTTMTKGIAVGLGVDEPVTSPTFPLKKTYTGELVLNHLDLYRLKNPDELEIIEPDELTEEGVTVVEWGQLLLNRLNTDYLEVQIEIPETSNGRMIKVIPHGLRYHRWVEELKNVDFGD